jgi:D-ribulokinase
VTSGDLSHGTSGNLSHGASGPRFYLGIDVGTGSVRAGIFDGAGARAGTGVAPIQHRGAPQEDFVEQSSDDIWAACGVAVRAALAEAKLAPESIAGIGVDATCSLVAFSTRRIARSP